MKDIFKFIIKKNPKCSVCWSVETEHHTFIGIYYTFCSQYQHKCRNKCFKLSSGLNQVFDIKGPRINQVVSYESCIMYLECLWDRMYLLELSSELRASIFVCPTIVLPRVYIWYSTKLHQVSLFIVTENFISYRRPTHHTTRPCTCK